MKPAFIRISLVLALLVAATVPAADYTHSFVVRADTDNCRDSKTTKHSVCCPSSYSDARAYKYNITSIAGHSGVQSIGFSSDEDRCVILHTSVAPHGEDCLRIPFAGEVCNCKGNGWIELDVQLRCQ